MEITISIPHDDKREFPSGAHMAAILVGLGDRGIFVAESTLTSNRYRSLIVIVTPTLVFGADIVAAVHGAVTSAGGDAAFVDVFAAGPMWPNLG